MTGSAALVLFRDDLRTYDNPALNAALVTGRPVTALYVLATEKSLRPVTGAARWWLHESLGALATQLAGLGVPLEVAEGDTTACVLAAVDACQAAAVFWNRRYAPAQRETDAALKSRLKGKGLDAQSFAANLLVEPFDIATRSGKPYEVFTPFWKALKQRDIPVPVQPRKGSKPVAAPDDPDGGYARPLWTSKLARYWTPGENGAREALVRLVDDRLDSYGRKRDLPAEQATSALSPHLRFGEISPRQVWHAVQAKAAEKPALASEADKFLSELAWRDFSYNLLFHKPDIASHSMQERFDGIAWRESEEELRRWQSGRTGIPIVDAGMRQLWETGWMHNRVRMLVASVLTKNLLMDWREGERRFWDTLVDADVANNPASWQWVAGCGADAAPYFRIFNPVTQGEKFDPDGAFVRRWVPELAELPDKWVHKPAEAPADVLARAGIEIGTDYPEPMVDLKASRERALKRLARHE